MARGAALVSGTTGLDERQRARLDEAGRTIPVLWASNFSLGVVVLEDGCLFPALHISRYPIDLIEMVQCRMMLIWRLVTVRASVARGGISSHKNWENPT